MIKHFHTYKAINKNRKVYKCTKEGCTHSINSSLLTGRQAECPACNQVFFVTDDNLRRNVIAHIKQCDKSDNPNAVQIDPAELLKKASERMTAEVEEERIREELKEENGNGQNESTKTSAL